MSDFEKNFRIQKIAFWFILLRENDMFCVYRGLFESMILYWKFHYVSDFELKKIQRVRFWIEKKYNATDLEIKSFRLVRFSI